MLNKIVKVAGIQTNPKILAKKTNLDECLKHVKTASSQGAQLLIFPECSLTGYCYNSLKEALPMAETIPGPSINAVASLCRKLKVYVVIGLLEKDNTKCYNSLALLGPNGFVGKYRKLHLPQLGVDRFVSHGNLPFQVFETEVGKIGMNICFDSRFPEVARILALLGAEIVVLPTNWPEGADLVPKYVINTRAYENRLHYIAVNRVGCERGFRFIGRSKIVHCSGTTLTQANSFKEQIIYAQLQPQESRKKHVVIKKDEFELPLFKERRPHLYGILSKKVSLI